MDCDAWFGSYSGHSRFIVEKPGGSSIIIGICSKVIVVTFPAADAGFLKGGGGTNY